MRDFAIFYHNNYGREIKVLWTGQSAKDALQTFWLSFHPADAREISNVRIFELVEITK